MSRHLAFVAVLALVAGARSASAQRASCPASNPPNELVLYGGSRQTAQLGTQFAAKLQAQLANTNGCPVTGDLAGVEVTFTAPGSGASGIFAGSGSSTVTLGTDGEGIASAPAFTADDTAGSYTVDAESAYGGVEFLLDNTAAGLAAGIGASEGSGQAAAVYAQYAQPLQARVTDANGNPVQGATVSFAVLPGVTGASASFLTGGQAIATTGSDGLATSPPLIANGRSGRFTAVASADGTSSVATYALDNHAAEQTLTALVGPQSTTIGTVYGSPLTVRLVDASGQPVEGGAVTFTAGLGAAFPGGLTEATVLTDTNGVATSPVLSAGGIAGSFTAMATAADAAPVAFALHSLPARVSLVVRSRSASVGRRYRTPLFVTIRDKRNRPIRGASVVFTVAAGDGASASFPDGSRKASVVTGANGRATAPLLVANATAGRFTVTAAIDGSSQSVRTRLETVAGRAATVTVGAASGESTPRSTRFPVPLAVTVTDRYGNRVTGVRVTFAAPAQGPSGSFAHGRTVRVRTNANGIAVAPPFTADGVVGGYLVRAFVKDTAARGSFALVNTPRA
jgi:hypothetical protein